MTHVEETLERCLEFVNNLNSTVSSDKLGDFSRDIQSALQIVKHESVQIPKDIKEAALMKQVAQMYLGEKEL